MGVDVYFNLHRGVWSVKDRQSGLVTGHSRVVAFAFGARMVVRQSGRERVLREGHKNVHAFIRGDDAEMHADVLGWLAFASGLPDATRITYNPHRAGYFTRKDNGQRIDNASAVIMVAPEEGPPQVWAVPA